MREFRRAGGRPPLSWVLWGLLLLSGCASTSPTTPGDAAFEAGAFVDAARAYRANLWQIEGPGIEDRTLWRLAVACSTAEAWDTNCAHDALERLLREFPDSPWSPVAHALQEVHLRHGSAAAELKASQSQLAGLRAEITIWSQRLTAAEAEIRQRGTTGGYVMQELETARRQSTQLRDQLAEREEQVERLRQELERLQAIDLGTPP